MGKKFDKVTTFASTQMHGLEDRPALEAKMPFRLDTIKSSFAQVVKYAAARPRMESRKTLATAKIHDLAYSLRGMLNANLEYLKGILEPGASQLKDFGAPSRKSRAAGAPGPSTADPVTPDADKGAA